MQNDKEKLVELIEQHCLVRIDVLDCTSTKDIECSECLVNHLVENGVTMHEWISVNDRLPQNFVSVLGYMTDAGELPPVRECYTVGNSFFFPALGDVHPVSHWMPLPEPPKGE